MPRQNRPRTVEEWFERLDSRLRAVERRDTLTLGEWVIDVDDDGNLTATNTATDTTTVLARKP